ncbi:MAG: MalY/PatB family protein [Candidatus Cloacimonadia bacterium]
MKYNFDKIIDRHGTNCLKWDFAGKVFGTSDLLPMWVADMDFEAPPAIIQALQKRAAHGIYGYTGFPDAYYDALISWLHSHYQWQIKKEWIIYTPGLVPAINFAIQAYTSPKDKIVVPTPVYPPFLKAVKNNQRTLLTSELIYDNSHYTIDFDDLERHFKSGAKMILLCSPHNPVGRVWTKFELTRLAELCKKYGVLIVSDEIHCDIVYHGFKHIPTASLSEDIAEQTITLLAPSKSFNIAGLSTSSVIISSDSLREKFVHLLDSLGLHGGNLFGIEAFIAVYTYGADWLGQLIIYLEQNYKFISQFCKEHIPNITLTKLEGTYLAWLDFKKLHMTQDELNDFIKYKAKLGLNNGSTFGPGGNGFMRLNFACPRSILHQGLLRLEHAVNRLAS